MFIGHFAIGFGAKAAAPKASLGTLFLAAQFLDLLWPTLLLLGLEHVVIRPGITKVTPLDFTSYPISHSLLTVCCWGLLLGLVYGLTRKNARGAIVVGLLVLSHWVLDLIVHRPDLPLYPGPSPLLGLGLWNSVAATVLVEALLFVLGLALYLRATKPRNRVGSYSLWALVVFLLLINVANMAGPPPESTTAIAWAGQLQWLIVLWGYWIDRNREAAPRSNNPTSVGVPDTGR